MEPIDYFRLLRRRWRLLAACVVVAATAAWVTAPSGDADAPVRYKADATIVRDAQASAPQALATVELFLRTGEVPRRVAERVGYEGNPVVLARSFDIVLDDQLGTLTLTATGNSPAAAADLTNAAIEEVLSLLGEQARAQQQDAVENVSADVTRLRTEIDELERRIEEAEAAGAPTDLMEAERDAKLSQYGTAVTEQARLTDLPPPSAGYLVLEPASEELASPADEGITAPRSKPVRAGIGVVLGLLLGVGASLVVERVDPRLFTREQAEAAFDLPIVAEIPDRGHVRDHAILLSQEPASSGAEAHRTLRASLLLMPTLTITPAGVRRPDAESNTEPRVVLITSPEPGDGKTTTVANLAAAFAETGRSVLVLGCDFRRPEIHQYLGAAGKPGLAEVFTGSTTDLTDVIQATTIENVRLAASGSSLSSLGDVASAGRQLVARARAYADIVLIDTAPMLATNDATELIPAVDSVVVVCRAGKTTREAARRTYELLGRLAAPVVGVALVAARTNDAAYYRYYTASANGSKARGEPGRRRRRRSRAAG